MGRRADSETLKIRKKRELMDNLYLEAAKLYREEHQPNTTFPEGRSKPLSLQAVCKEIEYRHFEKTGKHVPERLSKSTLDRHLKGGIPKSRSNAERGWLTLGEEREIVNYCLEMADRGFPLTHQDLRHEVNSILRARLGDDFQGIGLRWTYRFVEKHCKQLKMFWTSALEEKRGRAVNPHTNRRYFELLGDVKAGKRDWEFDVLVGVEEWADEGGVDDEVTLDAVDSVLGEDGDNGDNDSTPGATRAIPLPESASLPPIPIRDEDTYGSDEIGFQPSRGSKRRAIGAREKKIQHQQGDGGRENTTVIVSICGDGTYLKPTVIFKGKNFDINWVQENPAEAS
jgi:hypothetical protein